MRPLTAALTFGLAILWTGGNAGAATPGAVCRAVCAPRIAEQCPFLTKRALKACRKPILQACKQATPAVACGTSAELLRELNDRLVIVPDQTQGTSRDITLCATGQFELRELLADGTDAPPVEGAWTVRVAGGRLVLDLAGEGSPSASLPLERAASGDLTVDGLPALVSGDRGVCAPAVAGDDPEQRLVEITRKIADRALSTVVVEAARTTKRELTLCSNGTFTELVEIDDGGSPAGFSAHGRWTLRAEEREVSVELDDGTGALRSAAIGAGRGGDIVLDDAPADVRDARATCEAPPLAPQGPSLEEQLTAALRDTAFFFTEPSAIPNVPTRVKIGLCGTGRQVVLTTTTQSGSWAVRVDATAGPLLELSDDAGSVFRAFRLSFDAAGKVVLDGQHAPVDEPSIVAQACQS